MDTNLYSSCNYGNMMIETQIDIKLLCAFAAFSSPNRCFFSKYRLEVNKKQSLYKMERERQRVGSDIKDKRGVENVLRVAAH